MNEIFTKDYFPNAKNIKEKLFYLGELKDTSYKIITIVGTRRPSEYGKYCVNKIISGLAGYPISIVSGLAIGIDMLVHETAISNNIHTIAIPGSSLECNNIYPKRNLNLANSIIQNGGALVSMWQNQNAATWTFPARNSLMASISDLVLVIECKDNGGTMITAREARSIVLS